MKWLKTVKRRKVAILDSHALDFFLEDSIIMITVDNRCKSIHKIEKFSSVIEENLGENFPVNDCILAAWHVQLAKFISLKVHKRIYLRLKIKWRLCRIQWIIPIQLQDKHFTFYYREHSLYQPDDIGLNSFIPISLFIRINFNVNLCDAV